MKVVIRNYDLSSEGPDLELSRTVIPEEIRLKIAYDDGSGVDIVVARKDIEDAMRAL